MRFTDSSSRIDRVTTEVTTDLLISVLFDVVRQCLLFASSRTRVEWGRLGEPRRDKISCVPVFGRRGVKSGRPVSLLRRNIFAKASGETSWFTLEPENGKLYGSKGAGRIVANYSIAVDVAASLPRHGLFRSKVNFSRWHSTLRYH